MKPIDLTQAVSGRLAAFPGAPAPAFIPWSELGRDGYNLEMLFMSSHTGTHMDAPFHFAARGAKIHEIPVERCMGTGRLARMPRDAGQDITKRDIMEFEREDGRMEKGDSVFFYTGWQKMLGSSRYFTENPGLSKSAAEYLAARGVNMVGTDSPSVDCGKGGRFPAHKALCKADILIVENLAGLGRIRTRQFRFAVLPLKLKDATGSPVRAVAF